jgi:hypothetical protein
MVGAALEEHTDAHARIIGPNSSVLTYLSDRTVQTRLYRFLTTEEEQWPDLLMEAKFNYVILGPNLYPDDSRIRKMMESGILVPIEPIEDQANWAVAKFQLKKS